MEIAKLSELPIGCVFSPESEPEARYLKIKRPGGLTQPWQDPEMIFAVDLIAFKMSVLLESPVIKYDWELKCSIV
jgi:hypothetical protein